MKFIMKNMAKQIVERVFVNLLVKSQPQPYLSKFASSSYLNEHLPVRCISQSRLLYKDVDVLDHICEVSNFDEYLMNYKPVIQIMVRTLKEILDTTPAETNKIVEENPQLKKRSRANILNNYYNLIHAGVQKTTIMKNTWLLAHEDNKLKDKLDCIKVLNMNNDQLVPWLRLTQVELSNFVIYVQNDIASSMYNKIEHLAHRLECSIEKLCELTIRHSFLLKIPISCIDKKLDLLYDYDISNKNILKDLWVLRYSESHIRYRCELYKDTGKEVKPWAIRCSLKLITDTVQKTIIKRSIMKQHSSVSEYLMNKLNINEEMLNHAVTKSPSILRVNLSKLDRLINLLRKNEISSIEIVQQTKIFYFNIETVQNRINILKKHCLVPRLAVLTLSEFNFERYVEKNNIEREILQDYPDIKKYLIEKLDVDEKLLEIAISKWPTILRVNTIKMNKLIELLQQNGLTGNEILRTPRVFYFNAETLKKRIEILKEVGLVPKVYLLTYSQKEFDYYIKQQLYKYEKLQN